MARKKEGETRKLQVTGGSTFTISLPKKWIEEFGLSSGDEMIVEEKSSSLMLSPARLKEEETSEISIEINSEESFDAIKRKILSLYLVGYNKIRIKSAGERLRGDSRKAIKELVREKLVGTEIISESMEEITLQTLLSYSQLSAKGALKRMYRIASSMEDSVLVALKENDKELAEEVIELDNEIDRFQMYLIRQIKAALTDYSLLEEIGLETPTECMGYRLVSKHVERVGDHIALIAKNIIEMEEPVKDKTLEMLENMNSMAVEIFEKAMDSLFEDDYYAAEEVIQKMDDLYKKEEELNAYLSEEEPVETIKIRLMVESIRRISEYGRNIAEVVLNLTVEGS